MRKAVFALCFVIAAGTLVPSVQARIPRKKAARRGVHGRVAAHGTRRRPSRRAAAAASSATPFDRYRDAHPTANEILADPQISEPLKALLHRDFNKLVQNMQEIDYTEPLVTKDGTLVVRGGIPHLEVLAATYFSIAPNGKICAAIQDSGEKVLYYSNDPVTARRLTPDIERWRTKFATVPVVYKSK